MTHITCTVSDAFGTVNNKIPASVSNGADKSSHGRALPSGVRVWSIAYPIATFVIASRILEITGKITRNAPPHTFVSFRTSV